jgi:hypothetical protein
VNRFCSIFSQLLQLFPRQEFQQAVHDTGAERHARGFTCWGQFVAMLFCQLGRAHSLREICGGLASCEGKLKHLGIDAPCRSTLAYANEHRPWQLYERIFHQLLERCRQTVGPRRKFRFKNKLVSLDATTIDLCVQLFDWAKFRRTKGAVKLHLLLDHDGYLPQYMVITHGKAQEINVARKLRFQPGTILVFDRAYLDYDWLDHLTEEGVFFVTRPRQGYPYRVLQEIDVSSQHGILRHQLIQLAEKGDRSVLRRIEINVPDWNEPLVLVTNIVNLACSTVAAIYKERWQIELFFKAIKQNLRIKTFVGTSPNALKTQVWTALIALLLLRYLQLKSSWRWSLSNLVALLRMNLFVHRDLWDWINQPFSPPPPLPPGLQADLHFS